MLELLVGASRSVETLDLGPHVFAFRWRQGDAPRIVLWHEDPHRLNAEGLVERDQPIAVDLTRVASTDRVRVIPIVSETDVAGNAVRPPILLALVRAARIDTTPVIVQETRER